LRIFFLGLLLLGSLSSSAQKYFEDFDFHRADSIADHYHGASVQDLITLNDNLCANLDTEIEKFRALYFWVCHNIENDFRQFQKANRYRRKYFEDSIAFASWQNAYHLECMRNLYQNKRTVCSGYTSLLAQLCFLNGIECKVVNGYARSSSSNVDKLDYPNHTWLAVKLKDEWYLSDPTWSSGKVYQMGEMAKFEFHFNDGYFLCDPETFARNHYPLNSRWFLLETPPSPEDFVSQALVYGETFEFGIYIKEKFPFQQSLKRDETLKIPLEFHGEVPSSLGLEIDNGFRKFREEVEIWMDSMGQYYLSTTFGRTGDYSLHLLMGDTYLATFIISVER